jgi:Flp pilus assembly protein TadD
VSNSSDASASGQSAPAIPGTTPGDGAVQEQQRKSGGNLSPSANGPGGPGDASSAAAQFQRTAEAESLTAQGIQLCRTARWRSAIEPLRRATELDPANAVAFYYLGDACNHADELAHALEAFEAASRLQPEHWRALKGIGIVLDRMRRPQEAAAAYQRAREAQHKATPRLP